MSHAPPQSHLPSQGWLPSVPAPVKRVFDAFPLVTYPANPLPAQSSKKADDTRHRLYVFADAAAAKRGLPSFNPECLKWQTFLKFLSIDFTTIPSNNHASPSGSLPFLIPASTNPPPPPPTTTTTSTEPPVSQHNLEKWAIDNASTTSNSNSTPPSPNPHLHQSASDPSKPSPSTSPHQSVYLTLLNTAVRRAWLYTFYLDPENPGLAHTHYIAPATSNTLVRWVLARQLRRAAVREVTLGSGLAAEATGGTTGKSSGGGGGSSGSGVIDVDDIEADANEAFHALSLLLGEHDYFSGCFVDSNNGSGGGSDEPGLFDANVFAYTHLILNEHLGPSWGNNRLARYLGKYENLVRHRERIWARYWRAQIEERTFELSDMGSWW